LILTAAARLAAASLSASAATLTAIAFCSASRLALISAICFSRSAAAVARVVSTACSV
jgi:hypothetical protein